MGTHISSDKNGPQAPKTERAARRLVLLTDGEDSEVSKVLMEYQGADIRGTRIHQDLQRHALENQGRFVAAEWLGPLGWARFLWCRK